MSTDDVYAPSADELIDPKDILDIIARYCGQRSALLSILGDIQARYRHLPADALKIVSEKTGSSLVDVYGVATFYRSFSLKPKGKHLISVCLGTACHVRGGPAIAAEFKRQLSIEAGETTADQEFTLDAMNCLGACALGPVVVIDGRYFSKVRIPRVRELIDEALEGFDKVEIGKDKRVFPIEVACPHCGRSLMDPQRTIDGCPSVRLRMSFDHTQGWIGLSSLYGSHSISTEHDVPADALVAYFCPHCRTQLACPWRCPVCSAPMVPLALRGGGLLQICSRRGCTNHMLDLETRGQSQPFP